MQITEQGVAIRAARLAANMTQSHLAGLAGVSEKSVRRAEAGQRLQADTIRALCAALGLDASALRTEAELRPDKADEIQAALTAQDRRFRGGIRTFAASTFARACVGILHLRGVDVRPAWIPVEAVALPLGAVASAWIALGILPATRARAGALYRRMRSRLFYADALYQAALLPALLLAGAWMAAETVAAPSWGRAAAALATAFVCWISAGHVSDGLQDPEMEGARPGTLGAWVTRKATDRLVALGDRIEG